MKNYIISICLISGIVIYLASCNGDKSISNQEKPSRGKIIAEKSVKDPIDSCEFFNLNIKVVVEDTICYYVGDILPWQGNKCDTSADPIHFKVPVCEIPCWFVVGCDENGDFVKWKGHKDRRDTVDIMSYEKE
jgi:hypothetical protein